LLAKKGKKSEAIALGEEGLKLIKAGDTSKLPSFQRQMIADTERMVMEWKK